jgi:7-cyano-7-deazaguanine reductase
MPEYTSICPKTGLPDFGTITIRYEPDKLCLELKSLKMYFQAYRNIGIFSENAVNCMLRDIVAACRPVKAKVTGEFSSRGGMRSVIEAEYRKSASAL